jgi:hypothetical protein
LDCRGLRRRSLCLSGGGLRCGLLTQCAFFLIKKAQLLIKIIGWRSCAEPVTHLTHYRITLRLNFSKARLCWR